MTAAQLDLFTEAARNAEAPGTGAKGPKGLLLALVRQGLSEDALKPAMRLVLMLDAEPLGERKVAARG